MWTNYGRVRQATDDNKILHMRFACRKTYRATDTHSEFVTLFASPRQQWLRERPSMLSLYVHYVSCLIQRWLVAGLSPWRFVLHLIQGDQKVSVHLMITIQKVKSNVQSVPRQSPDISIH
jgi:hypothetical protein